MKNELFPLIPEPPIFVDELIAQANEDMIFGETEDIRKWGKEAKEKYEIQKMASLIRLKIGSIIN